MKLVVLLALLLLISCSKEDPKPKPEPAPTETPTPTPPTPTTPPAPPPPVQPIEEVKVFIFATPASVMCNETLKKLEAGLPIKTNVTVYVVYGYNFGEPATPEEIKKWKTDLKSRFSFMLDSDCMTYKKYFSDFNGACILPGSVVVKGAITKTFLGNAGDKVIKAVGEN